MVTATESGSMLGTMTKKTNEEKYDVDGVTRSIRAVSAMIRSEEVHSLQQAQVRVEGGECSEKSTRLVSWTQDKVLFFEFEFEIHVVSAWERSSC